MRAAAAAAKETPFAPGPDDAAALKQLAKQAGEAAHLLKMLANEKRPLILCFLAPAGAVARDARALTENAEQPARDGLCLAVDVDKDVFEDPMSRRPGVDREKG